MMTSVDSRLNIFWPQQQELRCRLPFNMHRQGLGSLCQKTIFPKAWRKVLPWSWLGLHDVVMLM